jgi:hypothetical protein
MDGFSTEESIDEIIEKFDVSRKTHETKELRVLSLAMPAPYKEKFDRLQFESKKEFGELLKEIIMRAIDKKLSA